jgi:hypothetical protein
MPSTPPFLGSSSIANDVAVINARTDHFARKEAEKQHAHDERSVPGQDSREGLWKRIKALLKKT